MSVRCKFKVIGITHMEQDAFTVKLTPVTSGSDENKQFYKWTPMGSIEFTSINPEAAKQFVVGTEYYVDIAPA